MKRTTRKIADLFSRRERRQPRRLAFLAMVAVLGSPLHAGDLPKLVQSGQPFGPGQWLVSDWEAGQSARTVWVPENVQMADGAIRLVMDMSPEDATDVRPVRGAEIQSGAVAQTGTWSWTAKAPEMVSGAIFGMFLYQADWQTQPWREFDFEFVGADTTKVQLNIHFVDEDGQHVSLDKARGGPVIVDLGFDAAEGFHEYAVTITETEAIFEIDGQIVGEFGPEDMPRQIWRLGPMRSFVDIWAVAPAQHGWAGVWQNIDAPLVAELRAVTVPTENVSR